MSRKILFCGIVFFVLILDRLTKLWALHSLALQGNFIIWNNILEFRFAKNTGMAFSFASSEPQVLMLLNSCIILGLILWVCWKADYNWGLACIIAGGLGNLIDRYQYGFVIDFINPLFVNFAIFNVADIALNLGTILLLYEEILKNWTGKRKELSN